MGTFHPAGDTSPTASSSPSPKAHTTKLAAKLPDDVRVVFESPLPKRPEKSALIKAYRNFETATILAVMSLGRNRPDRRYVTDRFTRNDRLLALKKRRHHTVVGTKRFFRTRVSSMQGRGAVVRTCVDERRYYDRKIKTDRPILTPLDDPANFYSVRTGLRRTGHRWRVVIQDRKQPDKECKR